MHRNQQDVLAWPELQKRGSDQGPFGEIERPPDFVGGNARDCRIEVARPLKLFYLELEPDIAIDLLNRLSVLFRESRSERLVPARHFPDASCKRVDVQLAGDLYAAADIVKRAARRKLIEEPQSLLAE